MLDESGAGGARASSAAPVVLPAGAAPAGRRARPGRPRSTRRSEPALDHDAIPAHPSPTRLAEVAGAVEASLDALLSDEAASGRDRPAGRGCWRRCATRCSAAASACGRSSSSRRRACSGARDAAPLRAGGAVELLHCYSLVHDDLPSMDDDDLRRGRPTVHRAFDEATAILAGDALQTLAFEVLADPGDRPGSGRPGRPRPRPRPRLRARRHGRRPDARPRGGGPLRRRPRLDARRRPPAAGHEDRRDPRLRGRGRRDPRPRRSPGPREPPGLRAGARRGLPDRRRHPRPRGLRGGHGQAHRQGPGQGQGHPGRPPRAGGRPAGVPPARRGRRRPSSRSAPGRTPCATRCASRSSAGPEAPHRSGVGTQ